MSLSIYPPLHPIYPDEWSSVPFDLQAPRQPSPLHRDQSSPWHCPYPGLATFTQDSPHFLFGRQATLQLLLTHLRQFNVFPLIGPVGSGKSSFLEVALLPELAHQGWRILGPLRTAGDVLETLLPTLQRWVSTIAAPHPIPIGIGTPSPISPRTLIAIDPLGTPSSSKGACSHPLRGFLEGLIQLTASSQGQVAVVVTVRSEDLDGWFCSSPLIQVLQHQAVWLPPLAPNEWIDAITKPAQLQGYCLEAGLLDRLLADRYHESQPLPLVQIALLQLWQRRDRCRRQLLHSRYNEMGRLAGAVNTYAEQIYATLSPAEQVWTQRLCLALVDRGPTGDRCRCPRALADLLALGSLSHQQAQIRQVITRLKEAGLLSVHPSVPPGQSFELATGCPRVWVALSQEILCDRWQRLNHWLTTHPLTVEPMLQKVAPFPAPVPATQSAITPPPNIGDSPAKTLPEYPGLRPRGWPVLDPVSPSAPVPGPVTVPSLPALADLKDRLAAHPVAGALLILAAANHAPHWLSPGDWLSFKGLLRQVLEVTRERYCFQAHPAGVTSFALSPEGTWLVSGGADGILGRWDCQGRALLPLIPGHQDLVAAIAVSPTGDLMVSGSWDGTLRLWDLAGNAIAEPFRGHTDLITAVTFSADGAFILSASADGSLRLWDRYGNLRQDFWQIAPDGVMAVACSPDGTTIAVGTIQGTLSLWTLSGQMSVPPITAHTAAITALAFSPDSQVIVSASSDGTLRLWDRQGQALGLPFQGHRDSVEAVAFSPDGQMILSGGADMTLRLWDRGGHLLSPPLVGHTDDVEAVAFSPDGHQALSASADGTIRVWDIWGNRLGPHLRGHEDVVEAIAFSPDGTQLISGGWDRTLRVWDLQNPTSPALWLGHTDFIAAVTFSHDGRLVASSSWDGKVYLWNRSGDCLHHYCLESAVAIACVCFSQDDQWLWAGSADGRIYRWSVAAQQPVARFAFQGHTHYVADLAVSPDGSYFLSASADGTLRRWDRDGHPIGHPFHGHTAAVTGVAISPDGHLIASGGWDGTLRLWDPQGQAIATLSQDGQLPISALTFSPDGSQMLVGYTNGSFCLWDVAAQAPIGSPCQAHTDFVSAVAFSPDGQKIAMSSADRTISLWRGGNWSDWLQAARDRLRYHPQAQKLRVDQ
ncbi:nSTAND1 domain-containing NTPase [Trichothermofontia sichuanensis]|uniref:nSTAND1 domain-containing NTPase n=1 Tax=Trichothermofontia sichuanensis TaxID=3045816 RepID=UPI0036F34BD7